MHSLSSNNDVETDRCKDTKQIDQWNQMTVPDTLTK